MEASSGLQIYIPLRCLIQETKPDVLTLWSFHTCALPYIHRWHSNSMYTHVRRKRVYALTWIQKKKTITRDLNIYISCQGLPYAMQHNYFHLPLFQFFLRLICKLVLCVCPLFLKRTMTWGKWWHNLQLTLIWVREGCARSSPSLSPPEPSVTGSSDQIFIRMTGDGPGCNGRPWSF